MELKDIIRNTTDTQPFNNFEIAILREIYRTLGGKINDYASTKKTDLNLLMDSNIIGNLALDKDILMYFYALYKNNLFNVLNKDGDFASIEEVVVPQMKEYQIKFYQNVNSWREIKNTVVSDDSDTALDAMDWEYDYGDVVDPELTTHIDDEIHQGDYDDVFDTNADVLRTLNESISKRKIIITESQLSKIEEDLKYWNVSDDDLDSYIVNGEHGDVKFKLPPEKILEKLTELSDLGNVVTTMRGGNGVAIVTDKNLVVKITGDKAEYITAKELEGINSKHIVKVHKSKVIDLDNQSIYTDDSKPAYLIIMDKLDSPTPQQEKDWFDCCCTEDKPIYVDFTDPNGKVVVHPPVDDYDKCSKIYNDIINIRKEVEKTGRRWVDIGIDNVAIKNGNYVLIDLGTNDPLPLNESISKRKIIITESQLSKIEEDLKYWSVSDANPNKNKYEMGVELEEEVTSIPIYKDNNPHKRIYEKMRREFPNTPEYVLQDYYRNIILMRAPGHRPAMKDILNTYNGDPIPYIKGDGNGWWYKYLKGPWKLHVLNVNPMDFDKRTVRAFEQRDFGNINAYNVPNDEERMDTQMSMRRDDGMNEPVIILQNPDGTYQLIEGWHRTMSILKMGDKPNENYYDEDDYNDELWDEETPTELKDWDKVKLRAFVAPNPDFKDK